MTWQILLTIFFLGLGLAMDAFSVSLTDGLTYTDINRKKSFFIAGTFGFMQALMPLIGFWLVEIIERIAGDIAGEKAGQIASISVKWIAFALLILTGVKMIVESIIELRKSQEDKVSKKFSYKEVIFYGFMTAIDACAAGVTLHAGLSNITTVWLHVAIILLITFGVSLIGLFLGKQILKLLKGRYEISGILGGSILIVLALVVVLF